MARPAGVGAAGHLVGTAVVVNGELVGRVPQDRHTSGLCQASYVHGRWDEAERLAREGLDLAVAYGYQFWERQVRAVLASGAALRGNADLSRTRSEETTTWAAPRGMELTEGYARSARNLAAIEQGDFEVIGFVLSTSVYEPIPGLAISNALRPALTGYAKTHAAELGPRGGRVVGLVPAHIETDRVRELQSITGDADSAVADLTLRRFDTPVEFGRTAALLLSPAASHVTGAMVTIDGGTRTSFQAIRNPAPVQALPLRAIPIRDRGRGR